tara:strand:+ start:1426 stop:2130 length:705 start_codon:yes stop_codon:yes gene_type:complete
MKFNANVIITNPLCHGDSGMLSVNSNIVEGTLYLWNTGQTSRSISAVDHLEYWVNVESPQGDIVYLKNISINQPVLLESNTETSIDSVSVTSAGGTGVRTIKWQDSTTSSYHRGHLVSNTTYTYTITDSVGCTLINSIKTKKLPTLNKHYITDSLFNASDFDGIKQMNTSTIWLDAKSIQDIKEGDLAYDNDTRKRKAINGLNLYYSISDSSNNLNEVSHIRVLINQKGEIKLP